MGSAKVSQNKPQLPMADQEKDKSIKTFLKSIFVKDKKKKKNREEKIRESEKEKKVEQPKVVDPAAALTAQLKKLDLEKNGKKEKVEEEEEDDEFKNFSIKVVEDDRRSCRNLSHSSEDSGFGDEKCTADKDVIESFEKLKIEEKCEKKKKVQTVVVPRGPTKGKQYGCCPRPYPARQLAGDSSYRQISQINQQTLSGGQVIVNSNPSLDNELDLALKNLGKVSQETRNQNQDDFFEDVLDLINKETSIEHEPPDILQEFGLKLDEEERIIIEANKVPEANPIEEFAESNPLPYYEETTDLQSEMLQLDDTSLQLCHPNTLNIFPTPPRSENVPSPMSESQTSFYRSTSEYTLSPERSSPNYNSDYEKYQDILPFVGTPELDQGDKNTLKRTMSNSSMTKKQYKDLQKEIGVNFSKKDCCQMNRKPCKELFEQHKQKLSLEERKFLCIEVSKLDLDKTAYGVLQKIIMSLSGGGENGSLQHSLFYLFCERMLAQNPAFFIGDFGLNLLKSAAFRCPHRPLLTRYLVQCVRSALKMNIDLAKNKECIFHEVDLQGDTLVIACARAGDEYASVLAELTRTDEQGDLPPLFRLRHRNSDGCSALHVACSRHSVSTPRLHVVHVLLEHAGMDLWEGDNKGGDTPLHLAVNSSNSDLHLILMIFKYVDQKQWKKLAHYTNLSLMTPLEYARSASKCANYEPKIHEFLKKCR